MVFFSLVRIAIFTDQTIGLQYLKLIQSHSTALIGNF